jgi:hypothetical protein
MTPALKPKLDQRKLVFVVLKYSDVHALDPK